MHRRSCRDGDASGSIRKTSTRLRVSRQSELLLLDVCTCLKGCSRIPAPSDWDSGWRGQNWPKKSCQGGTSEQKLVTDSEYGKYIRNYHLHKPPYQTTRMIPRP